MKAPKAPKTAAERGIRRHLDRLALARSTAGPPRAEPPQLRVVPSAEPSSGGDRTRAEPAAERGASAAIPLTPRRAKLTPDAERILALEAENAALRRRLADVLADDRVTMLCEKLGLEPGMAKLLAILWRKAPGTVRKAAIFALLYGDDAEGGPDPKVLDVWICRIRKLEMLRDQIQTVWGVGYRLTPAGRARLEALMGDSE